MAARASSTPGVVLIACQAVAWTGPSALTSWAVAVTSGPSAPSWCAACSAESTAEAGIRKLYHGSHRLALRAAAPSTATV